MPRNQVSITADADGKITEAAGGTRALLGWESFDLVGQPLTVLIPNEYLDAHRTAYRPTLAGQRSSQLAGHATDLYALHRDGHRVPITLLVRTPVDGTVTATLRRRRDASSVLTLVDRRHPVAVGCHIGIAVLAVLYVTNVADPLKLKSLAGSVVVERLWLVVLAVASVGILVSLFVRRRQVASALVVETVASFWIGITTGIYTWSILHHTPFDKWPFATTCLFAGYAAGNLVRGVQALRERGDLIGALARQKGGEAK